ncbi:MAG: hypothetical protein WB565_10370 [Acidimicrobiales bacterium]
METHLTVDRSRAARLPTNERHWPGRAARTPSGRPTPIRLRDRLCLYVVALPERLALPERIGLGAWLIALGSLVLQGGVFFDDSLLDTSPSAIGSLKEAIARQAVQRSFLSYPLRLDPLTVFNREVLARHGYVGRMPILGCDLGRTLGLLADYWVPAKRRGYVGGWSMGIRGWGVTVKESGIRRWSSSFGRPKLYVKAIGVHGLQAMFGYPRSNLEGMRRGVWIRDETGREVPYPGVFMDVISASFALDGTDSSDLNDHRRAWDLPVLDAPYAVPVTPDGISIVTGIVAATHTLTLALDEEARQWG